MDYLKTLLVNKINAAWILTLHRPDNRNSINETLLKEIHFVLDQAEQDTSCRCLVFQGENGIFCTGMDFQEVAQPVSGNKENFDSEEYMRILKRFTMTSKIIIVLLDGQVLAGGVGIVAASDIAISTSHTQFGLSEALWGLLPACVLPFLIRRIGFQKSYFMTLTTQTINATEAKTIGLIDELSDNLNDSLRRLLLRLNRIQEETVKDLKTYFRKLWIINETMEQTAVQEITRLANKPNVQANIKNFVEKQQFPWETTYKEML